jgi:TRAP-type C4-dicarboxylate transport system permease small subunit
MIYIKSANRRYRYVANKRICTERRMLTNGVERLAFSAARALAAFGLLILLASAATKLADGLMRWLINAPIDAVRDLGGLVIAIAVSCCFPLALLERSNIGIRFAEALMGRRTSQLLDAFAAVLATTVLTLIAWEFLLYAGKAAKGGDTTWMLGVPVAPFWYVVDSVWWCAVAVQTIVSIREIGRCFGHHWQTSATRLH